MKYATHTPIDLESTYSMSFVYIDLKSKINISDMLHQSNKKKCVMVMSSKLIDISGCTALSGDRTCVPQVCSPTTCHYAIEDVQKKRSSWLTII